MELKDLDSFMRIATSMSLSKAAREYGIPKATLSNHLRRLEKFLDVELFIRRSNSLELTSEGEELLKHCRKIFESCEYASETVRSMRSNLEGAFRISASPEFGTGVIGPILHRFSIKYPSLNVKVDLSPCDRHFTNEMDLDCIIFVGHPPDSHLIGRTLGHFCYETYASPNYVWEAGTPKIPQDLKDHKCLCYEQNNETESWFLKKSSETFSFTPSARISVNDNWLLKYMAMSGQGIAYLPNFFVRNETAMKALVPVLGGWRSEPTPIVALYPKQRHKSKALAFFLEYWIENFEEFSQNPPFSPSL